MIRPPPPRVPPPTPRGELAPLFTQPVKLVNELARF